MTTFNDSYTKQLQQLVTCSICLDHYQDPRLLPCSHTYCFQCIEKTVKNGNFNCPLKDDMTIDQNDIIHLPINRTVQYMVEFVLSINLSTDKRLYQQCDNCSENQAVNWCDKCTCHFCQSCTESTHSAKIFQSHAIVSLPEKVQSLCVDHLGEKFRYWCKQCEVLICRDCLLFQHKDHPYSSLTDAASEAKTKFQETVQEIEEIKQNLTKFSETTKDIINQQHEMFDQGKQDIEQTFTNLQRLLEERKRTILKQFEDNEVKSMNLLRQQQNTIDQHLNLTIVQEFCIKKMLDSDDSMQILKLKSTLSHNYQYFTEEYKKIDDGYTIASHTFEKDDKDVEKLSGIISKLGRINSNSHTVKRDGMQVNILPLDLSRVSGETKFTRIANISRGYKISLKQQLRLRSIRIRSNYIGQHVGFVVNDTNVVICNGTVNCNDSTMHWVTIPLKCDIKNNYTVLVWASSGSGSYAYKPGDNQFRAINQNCSVESKCVESAPRTSIGSQVPISVNTYSIDMILNVEE